MDIREVLNSINKDDLIDLIISYSNNKYYPLDLFLMSTKEYNFSYDEIRNHWENVVDLIYFFDNEGNPKTSDMLADAAELFFKQAQRFSKDNTEALLNRMVYDLTVAAEEGGIGMETDSEWQYLSIKDKIENYLEGKFVE